ncbi:MAG: universal stress protein [Deferrisomatales bacterium]|nr:universal stress protein [Deferrisomatales bacterium]
MEVTIRNILVPVDLGAASDRVVAYAAAMARSFGARVTALVVVDQAEGLKGLNLPLVSYDDLLPQLEERARKSLEAFGRNHLASVKDLELRVARGQPWERILEAVRETSADLVVMGTHGRRGLDRAIFGSTAERVLRRAPVPVVAVPLSESGAPEG